MLARARALADACASAGITLPQAALQFPLRHPAVAAVVVGLSSPGQVASATAGWRTQLTTRYGRTLMPSPRETRDVQRIASVIRLRPDKEAEYRALHAAVWPEVLAALKRAHVANYSIFLRDGMLFSYMEYHGTDYLADMASIAADPASQRWWKLTDPCQQPVESAAQDQWWAEAAEVFHLD